MAEEQYDANQGAVPPLPDPSDNLTPPPAPANPQDATAQAPVVPQTGETFTPMSEKSGASSASSWALWPSSSSWLSEPSP